MKGRKRIFQASLHSLIRKNLKQYKYSRLSEGLCEQLLLINKVNLMRISRNIPMVEYDGRSRVFIVGSKPYSMN